MAVRMKKRYMVLAAVLLSVFFFVMTAYADESWKNVDGGRVRVKEDGSTYVSEWFTVTSTPTAPHGKPSTSWYYAGADGIIYTNGWHEINGKMYYFYSGGNSPKNSNFAVDGVRYYVDADGARLGPGWFYIEKTDAKGTTTQTWYYANEDGSLLTSGWYDLDGATYYFDGSGINYRKRWFNLDSCRYYVDENGALQRGWFTISGVNSNGTEYTNYYYTDDTGNAWRGGWVDLDGQWYYFDSNGLNYRSRWYVDKATTERYYLGADGVLEDDGWFHIDKLDDAGEVTSSSWYYAQGNGAVLKDGFYQLDENTYYFDANGLNYRKKWYNKTSTDKYYFDENGVMYQEEWFVISGLNSKDAEYNNWYYADKYGRVILDRWYEIDGKMYRFNTSGVMRYGWITESAEDDDDEDAKYYTYEDGARVYGWNYIYIPDSWLDNTNLVTYASEHGQYAWFYFYKGTGKKKYPSSRTDVTIDGSTYCMDSDGVLYVGWVKKSTKTPEIKGYSYYYLPEGMEFNSAISEDSPLSTATPSDVYSADDPFKTGEKVKSAWLFIEGPSEVGASGEKEWYYFDSSGVPVCGDEDGYQIKKIQGSNYIFDMYGAAQYGLVEVDEEFYYCGTKEGDRVCVTGKVSIDDGSTDGKVQYYFDSDGEGYTGIKDGYLYYKGRLQSADKAAKYEMFDVPDVGLRLVNSSGKVVKGSKVTDGSDNKWEVTSGGKIEVYGSDEITEFMVPEATNDY